MGIFYGKTLDSRVWQKRLTKKRGCLFSWVSMWCWRRPPDIQEAAGVKYWAAGGGVNVPGDLCRTKKCIWTRRSPVAVPVTVRLSTQRGWHQYPWTRISKAGVLSMSLNSFWQMPFSKAAVCLKDTRTREFRDQTTDLIPANPVEEEGKWENESERGNGSFDACFHFKVFLFCRCFVYWI